MIFLKSRDQARPGLSFQSYATSARPGQRVSNLTGRLPGLAREILMICSMFFRAVSPPPRGFEAGTCSLARAPPLLWGVARSLQWAYETESAMPYTGLWIPLVRRGLRSALIRHISSHDKISRIVILFFVGKSEKNHVVNRDLLSRIVTVTITIHD